MAGMMEDMRCEVAGAREQTSKLLWECCRYELDTLAVTRALEGADTVQAVTAATEHGVEPLLWRAVSAAGMSDALGSQSTVLRSVADAYRMEALLVIPLAVARAVEPLTEAGLMPLVFKGPAVSGRYPQPGLRPMGDIDILLPAADHEHAIGVLVGAGWRVVRDRGAGHYDTVLVHQDVPFLSLEVHYGLESGSERVTALDPAVLWDRRELVDCAGTTAFGLSPADELVVLAAHAGKPFHGFTRLIWIADFAMVVGSAAASGSPIDWSRVRATAEEARCVTVVGAALELARHAGVQSPRGFFPLPRHGLRGHALRQLVSVTWPLAAHELHRYQLTYALTDAPAQRVRNLVVLFGRWHGLQRRFQTLYKRFRRLMGSKPQNPSASSMFSTDGECEASRPRFRESAAE